MILTLSNEKIGTPQGPMAWSNEKKKNLPVPYKESFLNQIQRSVISETLKNKWEASEAVARMRVYCRDTLDKDFQHYHLNYLSYLEKCWADHLGVVITPDIVWYTLLSEVAGLVKKSPETYRHLFSKSDKKEDIIVFSGDTVEMPLDVLVSALTAKVPTDTTAFFPDFSTQTSKSLHAFRAAFCDMCSPYYNYSMYCCKIPKIDVRGTLDDWKNLVDKWNNLSKVIGVSTWTETVSGVLNSLIENYQNKEFWKGIFSIRHCGSGGQIEVLGWFTQLFNFQPSVKYVENYSNHISIVKYKQLNFDQTFEMSVGIFGSKKEDELMVPDFSLVINEVL